MGKSKPPPKSCRIKESAYTPTAHLRTPSKPSASDSRTLQTTKLKKTETGGFKLVSSRGISGLNAPNVCSNDPRSTEEILESWYDASKDYGWDEAYVKSFVEKDMRPPTQDPETTTEANKSPRKGVSTTYSVSLNHTKSSQDPVLLDWSLEVDKFLRVVITLEGRGDSFREICPGVRGMSPGECGNEAVYRCLNCDNLGLVCGGCMVSTHRCHPFHRIEV